MNKRQYKKEYFICKDDFGKNIYAGDTVEVFTPITWKTPWTSVVYYDRLHGAMVKPRAIFKDQEGEFSHLYHYLGCSSYPIWTEGVEEPTIHKPYCKKIKSFI